MKTLRYTPAGGDMGEPHLITVGDDVAESLLVNERFTLADAPPPETAPEDPEPDTTPVPEELPEPPTPEQLVRES